MSIIFINAHMVNISMKTKNLESLVGGCFFSAGTCSAIANCYSPNVWFLVSSIVTYGLAAVQFYFAGKESAKSEYLKP